MGLMEFIRKIFRPAAGASGGDITLKCVQCGGDFVFEAGEREFFQEKGFQEPKRCPKCRKQKRFWGRGRRRR